MFDISVKFSDFCERTHRTTYFARVIGYVVADYYFSFRKLEVGTPEEEEMEHIVNLRSAERIFKMCESLFLSVLI